MKNIVIGVGNLLYKDEGIGIFAAEYLKKNYNFDNQLQIIDGGTLGFNLMSYFQEYDNIIILDTVSIDDIVGSIYKLPSEVLLGLGNYRKTAHEVEILEMLEACTLMGKLGNVVIIGIVPKNIIEVEIGLTSNLEKKFQDYIDEILKHIDSLDISFNKVDNISLNKLVKSMIGSYNGSHLDRIPNSEYSI